MEHMYRSFLLGTIFLVMSVFGNASSVLAGNNEQELLQRQAAEIEKLQVRLGNLEKAVQTLQDRNRDQDSGTADSRQVSETAIKEEYDTALALLKNGKFAEAEQKFGEFIQQRKNHKLNENALFWYAESFYRRDDFNQAAINYLKSYKEYPKGVKAADSLLKLGLSLGSLNKLKEACSIIDKLETEFPSRSEGSVKKAKEARMKFHCTPIKNKAKKQ